MLKRFLKRMWKDEKGITGLETAIILIAFVVVAAVFAYTVLSAGLFATQKSQEAVYSGLKEARSTLEMRGGVIAIADSTGDDGEIKQLSFVVSGALGGEAMDFIPPTADNATGLAADGSSNKVVISYVDQDQEFKDLYWTITKMGDADDDNLLEQYEQFKITIGASTTGSGAGNLIDVLTPDLSVNKKFSIIVATPVGAVLEIERTTPPYIDAIMNLH
jgi:flagellin FlaB